METSLITFPSTTRCYICGSSEIQCVCHHCHRPVCRRHGPAKPFLSFLRKNREFYGLDLEKSPAKNRSGAHCSNCAHSVPDAIKLMTWPGSILFVANFVAVFFLILYLLQLWTQCIYAEAASGVDVELMRVLGRAGGVTPPTLSPNDLKYQVFVPCTDATWTPPISYTIVAAVMMLLSASLYIGGLLTDRWLEKFEIEKHPPDLPIIPFIPSATPILVEETVRGQIQSTSGKEVSSVQSWAGIVRVPFRLGPADRDRWAAYQKRFKPEGNSLPARGGYLTLSGAKALRWSTPKQWEILPIERMIQDLPYLSTSSGQANRDWIQELTYTVVSDPRIEDRQIPESLPVRIRAYLVPGKAAREVALEVQLLADLPLEQRMGLQIDSLTVEFPTTALGRTTVQSPSAELIETKQGQQTLTWRGLSFKSDEQESGRKEFVLRLAVPAQHVARLQGRVSMSWQGLSSGITSVNLFFPLGHRDERADKAAQQWTRLIVDFSLEIAGIVAQSTARLVSAQERVKLTRRAPDDQFVCQLTEAIAQAGGFYVKNLIESAQQLSAVQGAMSCYWDITGRKYSQVHAVDFHLVVSGSISPNGSGETDIDVRVYGIANTRALEQEVQGVLKTLKTLVEHVK